jgi:hypothetical protein
MVVEPVNSDGVFSTAMDYMFAKFMAFEWLQGYLLELLNGGFPLLEGGAGRMGGERRVLRWRVIRSMRWNWVLRCMIPGS